MIWGGLAWTIAAMFAFTGVDKVRRPRLAAMALVDFGIARRAHPLYGVALGAGEVAISLSIVVVPRLGVVVSAVVLWAFAAIIARSLLRRDQFPCYCFGDSDALISSRSLIRTTVLATITTALVGANVKGFEATGLVQWLAQGLIVGVLVGMGHIMRRVYKLGM